MVLQYAALVATIFFADGTTTHNQTRVDDYRGCLNQANIQWASAVLTGKKIRTHLFTCYMHSSTNHVHSLNIVCNQGNICA